MVLKFATPVNVAKIARNLTDRNPKLNVICMGSAGMVEAGERMYVKELTYDHKGNVLLVEVAD